MARKIVIFAILIGVPLFYYFIIFLPQSTNKEFQAKREYKCIELASNERIKQEKENEIGEYLAEFKYKYDRDSDACLVYFRQSDNCPNTQNQNCRTYETIRNLFNSEIVAEFSYRPSDFLYPDTTSLFNKFNAKVKQTFGEQNNDSANIIDQTNKCLEIFEKKKQKYFGNEIGQHGVTFNKELNTCLVFNIYNDFETNEYHALTIDMITDKSLLFYDDTSKGSFLDENNQEIKCTNKYISFSYLENGQRKREYGCEKYELMDKMFEKIKSYGFEVFTAS